MFQKLLFLALSFSATVGAEPIDEFISDIIGEWQLRLPTIVAGNDLPELCMTHERVLCLSNGFDLDELSEHIAKLHLNRKQDGVIFTREEGHHQLLEKVTRLAPTLLTSNCPVFMPLDHSNNIELRLDSNIIFYEGQGSDEYKLVDIFAVKSGPQIKLELGIWTLLDGIIFQSQKNRWERRTDLKQATFINSVMDIGVVVQLIRDGDGKVVRSFGVYQDILFYITEHLNLTVKPEEIPSGRWERLENGSWTGGIGVLQRKEADVCSVGVGINIERNSVVGYPIPTDRASATLIAPNLKETVINMWAYYEIFGVTQWCIFIALLVSYIIIKTMFHELNHEIPQTSRISSALNATVTACMFMIQIGDHSSIKGLGNRILTLTTSMMTLVIFVYYSTDIIAKMTSGSSGIPVKMFEDVIQHEYKVFTTSSYYTSILADAPPGSAKNIVYKMHFEQLPVDAKAALKLISEPNTLWFDEKLSLVSGPNTAFDELSALSQVHTLKMDDEIYAIGTLALQKESEFLEIFNHYILKQHEHGILKRIFRSYVIELFTREKFGMSEPQPLGYENVIFTFSCLGFGIVASLGITIVELITKRVKYRSSSEAQEEGNLNGKQVATNEEVWAAMECLHRQLLQKQTSDKGTTIELQYKTMVLRVTTRESESDQDRFFNEAESF